MTRCFLKPSPRPQFLINFAHAIGGGCLNDEVLFLRYDSYEEYQHERLKREEYRRESEKRESERAKQRERQRQKAIVSSWELTFILQEGFFSFPVFSVPGGGHRLENKVKTLVRIRNTQPFGFKASVSLQSLLTQTIGKQNVRSVYFSSILPVSHSS